MTEPVARQEIPLESPLRRRRRWPWILSAVIGVIAVAAILLPSILSLDVVKQAMVIRMSRNLHGRLAISDWSIGWTSSELRGVRVYDNNQAEVLSVARLRTNLSLLDALRGNFKLGATEIEEPNFTQLVIGPGGRTNLQEIFQSTRFAMSGQPFSGDFAVSRLRATVVDRRDETTLIVDPSVLTMKIKSARDPIEYNLILNLRTTGAVIRSERAGAGALPLALRQLSGDDAIPLGSAALAGSEALLLAVNHSATPAAATLPPTAVKPAD